MLKDFQPVLFILLRFTFIYLVLFLGYQWYLNESASGGLDSFSQWVAVQVQYLQDFFGFPTALYHQPENFTTWFYVKEKYVSRMVEGCNAVSVMILFAAFVLAFYRGYKTFLYVIAGLVFLHLMNVLRIALLNMVLSDLPQFGKMTHNYLFPAFIYGMVVILWLVWIKFFALKTDESR
jgi:exosortase family protein XrtF